MLRRKPSTQPQPNHTDTLAGFKEAVIMLAVHDGVRVAELAIEASLDLLRDKNSTMRATIEQLSKELDDISSL